MTYQIKRNKRVYVKQETTPFTSEKASHAGADAVNCKYDAVELNPTQETIENMLIANGINPGKNEKGLKGSTGSISVYLKAMGTEGNKPEWSPLMEATLGATPDETATQNLDHTSATSTTTTLEFDTAPNFKVGQHVLIKEAGSFQIAPVESVGANNIVLAYALDTAPADGTAIGAVTTWNTKSEPTPFTMSQDIEKGSATESAFGNVVTSYTLSSVTAGQQPFQDYTFEGLGYSRDLTDLGLTPEYDTANAPVVKSACLVNTETGEKYDFSEFGLTIENTWQLITDACQENAKVGYKLVGRTVTGSFNPNKTTDSVEHWTNFDENVSYGLSIALKVPTATGEFGDCVCVYVPNVQTSNLTEGEDGVLKDNVEFRGFVDGDLTTDKALVYISSI